ncbi:hypothetical protein [Pseudoxanthomonas sp.]|uniref:hypothetical protein n=1 Tax=Pseudoxanthomonas sp. TaxID=1871049 RepID=UPI00261F5E07|nr:hypothetical protein [Pseudoxanthomonas sp.]WDS35815.1 MAG: hypothetical protein O8I58_16065 [Pseudoxanthomonas sp.]
MRHRKLAIYYAWSRPDEVSAPLGVIEDRFPSLFESRRMLFPRYEAFSDPDQFDQGIGGFLDCIMRRNFVELVRMAGALTGHPVIEIERIDGDGRFTPLDAQALGDADTLLVISFDSLRTAQQAGPDEIECVRRFLSDPRNLACISPHHDIGSDAADSHDARLAGQVAAFLHHGDRTIPPRQGFGGFARTLLAGLEIPVENRFGLRPSIEADGTPSPIEIEAGLDRLGLLCGVATFNLHPHLPQFERLGAAVDRLDVLARQRIDPAAPPHPFTATGRTLLDALLQSREGVFDGTLLVSDATLWSSTNGGVEQLQTLWRNVLTRA